MGEVNTAEEKINSGSGAAGQVKISAGPGAAPTWGLPAPAAHTLASHSTKAHAELTGVGADDHHTQSHTHASHTGIGADDHHAKAHGAAEHTNVTRWLYLPVTGGYIMGGVVSMIGRFASILGGADLDEPNVAITMKVPDDFVSFTSLEAVWQSQAAGGNMYWQFLIEYGAPGEAYNTHSDSLGNGASASGGFNKINVSSRGVTLVSLALGDYIGIHFVREGTNALDTLNQTVNLFGLLFTYIANQ